MEDNKPTRPACFEFAMDFLGGPEEKEIRSYIERLENYKLKVDYLEGELKKAKRDKVWVFFSGAAIPIGWVIADVLKLWG